MSTRFKALEAQNSAAAYQMEAAIKNVEGQISSTANQTRAAARAEVASALEKSRQEQLQRENTVINKLNATADSKIAALEVKQRKAMQERTQAMHELLKSQGEKLADEMQAQENSLTKKVSEVDAKIRLDLYQSEENLNKKIDKAKRETVHLLGNFSKQVTKELEAQKAQINGLNTQLSGVKDELKAIAERHSGNQEVATQLTNRCLDLLKECQKSLAVNRFDVTQLNRLMTKHEYAFGIFGSNAPQGTMSTAVQLLSELWTLQEETELKQTVFEAVYANSLAAASSLLKNIAMHKADFLKTELEKNAQEDETTDQHVKDINFWMQGEYTKLEEKLSQLTQDLEEKKDDSAFTLEMLTNVFQDIKELEVRENEMVILATLRAIASEKRAHMCMDIVEKLQINHFEVKQDELGYIKGDFTQGVYANMINSVGTDLTILVVPDEELTKNKVLIQRNDNRVLTDREMQEISDLLISCLEANGNSEVHRKAVPDERIFDQNALKASGLSPKAESIISAIK